MRSENELRDSLQRCYAVAAFGMSKGPCPRSEKNREGCCAECSFPSAITWVLGADINPSHNAQQKLIQIMKEEEK